MKNGLKTYLQVCSPFNKEDDAKADILSLILTDIVGSSGNFNTDDISLITGLVHSKGQFYIFTSILCCLVNKRYLHDDELLNIMSMIQGVIERNCNTSNENTYYALLYEVVTNYPELLNCE